MAEAMQFDLVSPEEKLMSSQTSMVQIPGVDGDFAAMAGHEPTVTSLRPGILRAVETNGTVSEFVVSGGFAEISEAGTTVLVERAAPKHLADEDLMAAIIAQAEAAVARHEDDPIAKAAAMTALDDVNFLKSSL